MTGSEKITAAAIAAALGELREQAPLVQCLTNVVVAQWTANVLLAVGAAPAMVDNPREAGDFAAVAGGVLVNLGTPYTETADAMTVAVRAALAHETPWVLDPVAVGALAWRTDLARQLLAIAAPAVIRGNASEVLALAGGTGGKGVETVDTPEAAADTAAELARQHQTVVAVSGPVDHLTDGNRMVTITNGHPWLTRVTGVGCALGALMAAFTAVTGDRLLAAAAATATLTVAAEQAVPSAQGPGSFAVALIDQLANLSPSDLERRVRLGGS
jgi:hydroxyethylthiazole kinase